MVKIVTLSEQMNAMNSIYEACISLESEANISEAMKKARDGQFIPLGALGEKVSPDEYFADEYDHFRNSVRDVYFSVQNLELRRKLIAEQRKIDNLILSSFDADVENAQQLRSVARIKIHNQPWLKKSAAIVFILISIGYFADDAQGAIIGFVIGIVLGQILIIDGKNEALSEVNSATQTLTTAQNERKQQSLFPECFSASEETTGERDSLLDRISAYGNLVREN